MSTEKPDTRPRGRPRMDPSERKTVMIRVLLTPAESAALTAAAERAGLTVSAYVRRRALPKST